MTRPPSHPSRYSGGSSARPELRKVCPDLGRDLCRCLARNRLLELSAERTIAPTISWGHAQTQSCHPQRRLSTKGLRRSLMHAAQLTTHESPVTSHQSLVTVLYQHLTRSVVRTVNGHGRLPGHQSLITTHLRRSLVNKNRPYAHSPLLPRSPFVPLSVLPSRSNPRRHRPRPNSAAHRRLRLRRQDRQR